MKVCVLIPAYNESKAIGELVAKARDEGLDVLVVDDGSSDDTGRIARERGALVIAQKNNRGKGASLKDGFAYALKSGYEAVVVMDGDGQHDPEDVKRFIQTAQSTDSDVVVGNRMGDPMTMPLIRRLTNRYMSNFISKICGQEIPDTQCGFRLIKRGVLEKVKLVSSKYETESEILIRAVRGKFKILSIPIKSVYNNEASSIRPLKDALRFVRLVLNIMFEKKNVNK